MSGDKLDIEGVNKARAEDIAEVHKHNLYTKVPIKECWDNTGKGPIGTRWVDANKGDEVNPEYRSRLVAQEVKTDRREDRFAATPPLEAKKMLRSRAVIEGIGYNGRREAGMKLGFIDVTRAYVHARARRELFVTLLDEDYTDGMCGRLNKAMYGTSDAAQHWESAHIECMSEFECSRGAATPCICPHAERYIRVVVHGDDVTILGHLEQIDWSKKRMESTYDIKYRGHIGPQRKDEKNMMILNRIVEWIEDGIVYESGQRHAYIIVRYLNLSQANGVVTPGEKKDIKTSNALNQSQATRYRARVARGIYLAPDRRDIAYVVMELSRNMPNPDCSDWASLKRLGRYLVNQSSVQTLPAYPLGVSELTIGAGSDDAGCARTRKNTRGGLAMFGVHCIKGWGSTQGVVALSSGEAAFYAMVKWQFDGKWSQTFIERHGTQSGNHIKERCKCSKRDSTSHRLRKGKAH